MPYKIVDLFAGPGGLGEGFASYQGGSKFEIALSAEMEASAHKTLTLRSFFRHIQGDSRALAAYYDYCHLDDAQHPSVREPVAWAKATGEAHQLTLGNPDHNRKLDELITESALKDGETVLIGGPPCQAYSLVGRSRNRGKGGYVAEEDHRHFLYKEYLRIIHSTKPSVFVMENVKGILSSKVNGGLVFHDILRDLADPGKALHQSNGLKYTIHSLVSPVSFSAGMDPASIDANAFIIEAEKYGVPQARHRVILLGVREDMQYGGGLQLAHTSTVSVNEAIGALPRLRSRLSSGDTDDSWRSAAQGHASRLHAAAKMMGDLQLAFKLQEQAIELGRTLDTGALRHPRSEVAAKSSTYHDWVKDDRLKVWLNHEARSHMSSDLGRYFYTAVFGLLHKRTPKSHHDFPLEGLAPNHKNWESGKFIDRFRVQLGDQPSTTVTSHIAKDGHYFIHPDPTQCRSLTVREAARLQSFPDNYFFEGNRTQQYHQVGNAVPSLLAHQIAGIVDAVLSQGKSARKLTPTFPVEK